MWKVILVNKMVKQLTFQFSANFYDALKRITLQSGQFGVARPLVDTSRHALPAVTKAQHTHRIIDLFQEHYSLLKSRKALTHTRTHTSKGSSSSGNHLLAGLNGSDQTFTPTGRKT